MSSHDVSKDESWFVDADCPQFFDFTSALQAPCSTDLLQNPPLHDFVYESDEESRRFFNPAAESLASPHPKRLQKGVLDPKYFGDPVYRHRPEIPFDEYLRTYEESKKRGARRSVHTHVLARENLQETPSSAQQVLPRNRAAPQGRYNRGGLEPKAAQPHDNFQSDEEQDITLDLKTPTLDSIVTPTPTSMRRARRQFTPSRILKPTDLNKSFFNSSPPSASPLRKSRTFTQKSQPAANDSVQSFRSSTTDSTTPEMVMSSSRLGKCEIRTTPARISRLPERTTPSTGGGQSSSGGGTFPTKGHTKSRPYVEHAPNPSPDIRIRPPQRATRPSPTTVSSDSDAPLSNEKALIQRRACPLPSETTDRSHVIERGSEVRQPQLATRNQRKQKAKSARDLQPVALKDDSGNIDDSDLVRKLKEHNRRIRKSARHGTEDMLPMGIDAEPETGSQASGVRQNPVEGKLQPESVPVPSEKAGPIVPHAAAVPNESTLTLNEILQSENDRVLRKRRDKLPERSKEWQKNREKALKHMEEQRGAVKAHQKRTFVNVKFTSSKVASKPRPTVNSRQAVTDKTSSKLNGTGEMQGFRARAKSSGPAISTGTRPRNLHSASSREAPLSRQETKKGSVTDQVKALAKQQREIRRMENHLQALLTQHNSRVKSSRQGQG